MWFPSGLLSSFLSTVGLTVQFFQREPQVCPFHGPEMLLLWPCSPARCPSGTQGHFQPQFLLQGPQGCPLPRALPPWLLFASLPPHLLQAITPFMRKPRIPCRKIAAEPPFPSLCSSSPSLLAANSSLPWCIWYKHLLELINTFGIYQCSRDVYWPDRKLWWDQGSWRLPDPVCWPGWMWGQVLIPNPGPPSF